MKLEKNMYVRTKGGYIAKLIDVDYEEEYYEFDKGIVWFYEYLKEMFDFDDEDLAEQITKASHNIIDLIEVGDYVNGHKVYDDFRLDTDDYGNNFIEIGIESDKFLNHYIREDDIKSIVTKEQFESVSYKVGD